MSVSLDYHRQCTLQRRWFFRCLCLLCQCCFSLPPSPMSAICICMTDLCFRRVQRREGWHVNLIRSRTRKTQRDVYAVAVANIQLACYGLIIDIAWGMWNILHVVLFCAVSNSSSKQKDEAEVKKEIQSIIRQITASVTFLPMIESPCMCHHFSVRDMLRTQLFHQWTGIIQDAQLSQRDRAAGYISFGRKWKTGTQRQYFTDIVSLASTTVT